MRPTYVQSGWLQAALLLSALAAGACLDRSMSDEGETGEDPAAEERPLEGGLYASCNDVIHCSIGLDCFHPQGEDGYCTDACLSDLNCQAVMGSEESGACVGVLGSEASVCALECDSQACPYAMRCETVEVQSGAKRLCF